MKSDTLQLFSFEIIKSYRGTKERIFKNPVMTIWFIILLFVGFGTVLFLIEYATTLDELLISPTQGDIIFFLFFLIMAKASAETVNNTLRNERLKHLFVSPVNLRSIIFTRLLKVFWYNLLLIAVSMSIITSLVLSFDLYIPLENSFVPRLYLFLFLAPIIGFMMAIFSHMRSLLSKVGALLIYGQTIPLLWWMMHRNFFGVFQISVVISIGSLSFLFLFLYPGPFLESWKNGIISSTDKALRFHNAGDFLPNILPLDIRQIAEKGIFTRWRKRELPSTIGVTLLISLGLYLIYLQLGTNPDLGLDLGKFIYPLFIGMGLYLAIILQIVLPSLTLFSREGKRLWGMKTLPIHEYDLVWGKVLSILLFSPIIPLVICIPLPILLGYPIIFILFAIFGAITMIFSFMAIGIWASVRFPNFDEEVKGAPDIITMYSVLIICLIIGSILVSFPLYFFQIDYFLGFLLMMLSTGVSITFLVLMVKRVAYLYKKIEIDF